MAKKPDETALGEDIGAMNRELVAMIRHHINQATTSYLPPETCNAISTLVTAAVQLQSVTTNKTTSL